MARAPRRLELAYDEGPTQSVGLGQPHSDAYVDYLARRHREEAEIMAGDVRKRDELNKTLVAAAQEASLLIGAERYDRLRRHASSRREERVRRFANGQPIDTTALTEFDRETRRQAEEALRGADLGSLIKVRDAHRQRIRALVSRGERPITVPVPDAEVPEEIRSPTHNPPILRTPPYSTGWAYGSVYYNGPKAPTLSYFADRVTGRLGSQMHYENDSADDYDFCDMHCRSYFGFDLAPQGAGKWEFWFKVRWDLDSAAFYFDDDFFGFSNAWCTQMAALIISISTQPPENLANGYVDEPATYWRWDWGGANIDYANTFSAYPTGLVNWFKYVTPFTLPSKVAFVRVGSAETLDAYVDDTSVNHTLTNRMFLEQVSIKAPV